MSFIFLSNIIPINWYNVVFDRKIKLIYNTNTQQDALLKGFACHPLSHWFLVYKQKPYVLQHLEPKYSR
jgi:hypothetical protein